MVGLYTGPGPDHPEAAAEGGIVPYWTGIGAAFGAGFASDVTPRLFGETGREIATTGVSGVDELGNPLIAAQPEPTIDPATANAKYGINGSLSFDQPVPESVAQDLYEYHRDQLFREDTMQRAGVGAIARFSTGIATSLLDPINAAAAFVPGIGEERAAQIIGGAGMEALSATGRVGARVLAGGSAGLFGTTALQPVEGALAASERADYTMHDALMNVAMGTVLGGGLHVVGGAVADRVTGRYANPISQALEDAGPETRETLLRGAVAQLAEGRQVDVGSAFDALEAGRARDELISFADAQSKIEADADAALTQAGTSQDAVAARRAAADEAQTRLMSLQTEAEGLRSDLSDAQDAANFYADPTTTERLAQIEGELGGSAVPAVRRSQLEAERQMLTEGGQLSPEEMQLQQGRSEAEARALAAALDRNQKGQLAAASDLGTAQGEGAAFDATGTRAFNIQAARIGSRQAVTQALAERSVRRLAYRLGVGVGEDEIPGLAQRALSAPRGQARQVVGGIVRDLAARRPDIDEPVEGSFQQGGLGAVVAAATKPLADMQRVAAGELMDKARQSYQPSADEVRVSRMADEAARDQTPDAAKLEAHVAELESMGNPEDAEAKAEIAGARELTDAADAKAQAIEQAASCVAQGMA